MRKLDTYRTPNTYEIGLSISDDAVILETYYHVFLPCRPVQWIIRVVRWLWNQNDVRIFARPVFQLTQLDALVCTESGSIGIIIEDCCPWDML